MSIRTLLIWIIIAGTLGGVVIAIKAQQNKALLTKPAAASRLISFDPASTITLERAVANQREILQQDPAEPGRWTIHWSHAGMDHQWAAQPSKVRSALRTLATARILPADENLITTSAGEFIIRQLNGDSIRIEFDASSSGGYTPVRIEERDNQGIATAMWFGRIEKKITDAFIPKPIKDWRSDRIFEMPNSAVRGVELSAMGTSVKLARTNTGWMIQKPIQIHGDTTQVEDLVKILTSLEAATFVDDPLDPATTGLGTPIATIRVSTTDESSTLTIGTRADIDGARVYAQLNTSTGSALVTLETDQLAKLTAVVDAYIAKTPSPQSLSAINAVRIEGRDGKMRLKADKSAGNWIIAGAQADSLNRDAIERLLSVLIRDQAPLVRLLDANTPIEPLGYVELLGKNEQPLNRFAIALDSTDAGMRLLILHKLASEQQILWASNTDEALATGAWLTAVAGKRVP